MGECAPALAEGRSVKVTIKTKLYVMKNSFAAQQLRKWFLFGALLIVVASVLYANRLASRLADEERRKMEVWADATREFILADENTNVDFVSRIIEGNTTIPVIMTDSAGNYMLSRNFEEPRDRVDEFYKKKIRKLRETQEPIEVRVGGVVQYIYYEDSTLLRQLQYFPYIQFSLIFLFILIAIFTLSVVQRSEENRVWVGLSKETAHQLGTPISSLYGWEELLRNKYPEDELIPEMEKDIKRLQTIAERFSKVGSEPELKPTQLLPMLENTINYMRTRTSGKVQFDTEGLAGAEGVEVMMSEPLLEWVIENLCKNAVDAMDGAGVISFNVSRDDKKVNIDIADTGKGIRERDFNKVFMPGYTTKKRGWGLGLSLAKRIVEQYHGGKIMVLRSELGKGTTFRVQLG